MTAIVAYPMGDGRELMTRRRLCVLFLTNWYPTAEEPTKAVWVREHAKAVRRHDDPVVLHCVGPDPDLTVRWHMRRETDETLTEGIPTYRMRYRPFRGPAGSYLAYVWSTWCGWQRLAADGFRPDLLHVHVYDAGGPGVLIGRLNRIPVVVTEHFSSFPRKLLGRLDVWKAWLAFRWADRVLPVSRALQRAIEDYGIQGNFVVIPNVADTAIFAPPAHPRSPHVVRRLLFVGSLTPVKGIPYLLEALHQLRQRREDWHLDVVGDGVSRSEYEHLAERLTLSDKITFHGLKTKPEVAEFMRGADLFVLPSLCETFSAPAAEALTTGTPVLATRCGGPEEFVTDAVGVLVAAGDARALREGLDHCLDNLHLYSRRRISEYASDLFAAELVGAKLHALYQSLTTPRG